MITLTEAAIKEVERHLEKAQRPGLYLRVGVKGGGCAGMEYVMSFDTAKKEWDQEFTANGIRVLVDAKSQLFLEATTIDFSQELVNGGWKFTNPNAKGSCGCGTSFAV